MKKNIKRIVVSILVILKSTIIIIIIIVIVIIIMFIIKLRQKNRKIKKKNIFLKKAIGNVLKLNVKIKILQEEILVIDVVLQNH
jgi:heme/copper-type cytochrome/quinol oxidase subunit 2